MRNNVARISTVRAGDGSVSAPSHSFINDTDTGAYLIGADVLGLATGGTERVRVNASGQVGIDADPAALVAVQIGSTTGLSTATPKVFSLGGTYSNAAGQNPKIRLLDDGASIVGIGVSASQLDYMAPTGVSHVFYINAVEQGRINTSGQWAMGDGLVGTPTYSFGSDLNTGIYRVGVDTIGISTGGTLRAQVNASGQFLVGDGAVGTPTIGFASDTNTGLYWVSADILGVTVGGAERVRFSTTQALGSNGSVSAPYWGFAGDVNTGMYWISADILALAAGGVEAFRTSATQAGFFSGAVAANNWVQVGTQSAVSTATPVRLSLGGTYSNSAGSNPKLLVYDDGTNAEGFGVSASFLEFLVPTGVGFNWYINAASKMVLTSGGALGIGGTPASNVSLQLGTTTSTSTATPQVLSLGGTYSNSAGANPKIRLYDDGAGGIYGIGVSGGQTDYLNPTSSAHVFYIGGTERFKITATAITAISSHLVAHAGNLHIEAQNTSSNTSEAVTWADAYAVAPYVVATAQGTTAVICTVASITTTGATAYSFDAAGVAASAVKYLLALKTSFGTV